MRRAAKITLKFATAKKRRAIAALLEAYRAAVNFYIRSLWVDKGGLDSVTLNRLLANKTRLSTRYRSQALKQALETIIATRKSVKALKTYAQCPVFRGSAILDAKFITIEAGRGSFDLIVRISTLHTGQRITVPTKRTAVLNRWCDRGTIIQGCALSETGLVLWVNIPDEPFRETGVTLGLDIGINKLVSDSDGNHYGTEFKAIRDKIRRSKPKSKARYRHFAERNNYINFVVNQLPWLLVAVLGIESLANMKRGKKKNRSKAFRKAIAPWTYRRVTERIGHKAQENRIHLVAVPPAYTSQTCPVCGRCEKENRSGGRFACVGCDYSADADYVGARNILAVTLRSVESLGPIEAMI
jgi:IS605 OrfB family transposase